MVSTSERLRLGGYQLVQACKWPRLVHTFFKPYLAPSRSDFFPCVRYSVTNIPGSTSCDFALKTVCAISLVANLTRTGATGNGVRLFDFAFGNLKRFTD